jgi:hypothetical protein
MTSCRRSITTSSCAYSSRAKHETVEAAHILDPPQMEVKRTRTTLRPPGLRSLSRIPRSCQESLRWIGVVAAVAALFEEDAEEAGDAAEGGVLGLVFGRELGLWR